jgi:hypothetical protein
MAGQSVTEISFQHGMFSASTRTVTCPECMTQKLRFVFLDNGGAVCSDCALNHDKLQRALLAFETGLQLATVVALDEVTAEVVQPDPDTEYWARLNRETRARDLEIELRQFRKSRQRASGRFAKLGR